MAREKRVHQDGPSFVCFFSSVILETCPPGDDTHSHSGILAIPALGPSQVHVHIPGVSLLVGCLTSQKHVSVSQGRICSDKFTCCHTEIEVADQTFHLTQSQYTDTGPTSLSADPISPGALQDSHWSTNFLSHWFDLTRKNPGASGIRTPDFPLSRRTP